MIPDHCNKHDNDQVWSISNCQNVTQTHKVSRCSWGKMEPIDLLGTGLSQIFKLLRKNVVSATCSKVKGSKMRFACVHWQRWFSCVNSVILEQSISDYLMIKVSFNQEDIVLYSRSCYLSFLKKSRGQWLITIGCTLIFLFNLKDIQGYS